MVVMIVVVASTPLRSAPDCMIYEHIHTRTSARPNGADGDWGTAPGEGVAGTRRRGRGGRDTAPGEGWQGHGAGEGWQGHGAGGGVAGTRRRGRGGRGRCGAGGGVVGLGYSARGGVAGVRRQEKAVGAGHGK